MVADTAQHHPKGVSQAYADIGNTLANYGFNRVQGSLYTNASEDLANLLPPVAGVWAWSQIRRLRFSLTEKGSIFGQEFTAEHAEDAELR